MCADVVLPSCVLHPLELQSSTQVNIAGWVCVCEVYEI